MFMNGNYVNYSETDKKLSNRRETARQLCMSM